MSNDAKHFTAGPTRYFFQDPETGRTYEIPGWMSRHLEIHPRWAQKTVVSEVNEEAGTITFTSVKKTCGVPGCDREAPLGMCYEHDDWTQ